MDATPSVQFNFEDASVEGFSKEPLSFGLSATSHQQQSSAKQTKREALPASPYTSIKLDDSKGQEQRALARSILHEIENAQSPVRQRVHRLKTDEFFDQFDRVFEVRFDSPVHPNESGVELQQSTQPLSDSPLRKDFSNSRHPRFKQSPTVDRKTESCSLGQERNSKVLGRSIQKEVKGILRRKQRLETKPVTSSNTYRAGELKDITNCNRTLHQLSIVSVEAKERKDLFERLHQVPTIKRGSKPSRFEFDQLHTAMNKCAPIRDTFLRSGTLENWKRKFHERRMRSRETDLTRTVKIRSLGCRRRCHPEPIKVVDFHIQRRLRC